MFILKQVVLKNKGLLYFLPNIQALLDFRGLIMTIIFLLLKANNTNSPSILHYFSRTNKAPLTLVFNKRPVYKGDFTVLIPYTLIYKTKKLYFEAFSQATIQNNKAEYVCGNATPPS